MPHIDHFDKLFIGGSWVAPISPDTIAVISPNTETVIATVPSSSTADIDRAVASARDAFDNGPWPRMSLHERSDILTAVSKAMESIEDDLARSVSEEMGCPITLSTTMQSRNPRILLDNFIELAQTYPWNELRRSSSGQALVTREAVGVVAAVVPWNAPLLTTLIKITPALLSGCTIVLKPAPEAPLSLYRLTDLFAAAGLPAGVLNVVPADRAVSEYLISHAGVDKVSFTGSTAAGRRIAAVCGNDLRRVTLELGGKSAAVVLPDADLDLVIENVRTLSLRNSGQVCTNKTRLVVPAELEAQLRDRLVTMIEDMPVGDPMDPATQIGPMVSATQRERVENYIAIGQDEGAKLLIGGARPRDLPRGWFVEPTIFTGVEPRMRIAQEEIFGPVLAVLTYSGEDEAVAIANNSDYGLNGSVFSADDDHALTIARRIRTGAVEINGRPVGWHAPVGGFKSSGIGREAGPEGFDAYVESKSYGLSPTLADTLAADHV